MYRQKFIFSILGLLLLCILSRGEKTSLVIAYAIVVSIYFIGWLIRTKKYAQTIKKYIEKDKILSKNFEKIKKVNINIPKCIFLKDEITCTIQTEENQKATFKFYIEYDEEFDVIDIISYEKC